MVMKDFYHTFHVSAKDIDENDHVNNVAYVQWIQDVALAHWLAVTDLEMRERYIWMLTRHEVDYKLQAFENEQVTATTWVGEATRVTFERFTEITRGEHLLVKAKSIWCLIDRQKGRPARITTEIKDMFR